MNMIPELAAIAAELTALDRGLDAIWDRADWKLRYRLDLIYRSGPMSTWGPALARLANALADEAAATAESERAIVEAVGAEGGRG